MERKLRSCAKERRSRRELPAVKPASDFRGFPESAKRGAVLSGTWLCRVQSFQVLKGLEWWAVRGPEVPGTSMRWLEGKSQMEVISR
jgi:hypothetical protein